MTTPIPEPTFTATYPDEIFCGAISPSHDLWLTGTVAGHTRLYSTSTSTSSPLLFHYSIGSVRALHFSPTNSSFLSGDSSGNLFLFDVTTHTPISIIQKAHRQPIECLSHLSSSIYIAGDTGGQIRVWDIRTTSSVQTYSVEDDYVADIVSIDSKNFVASHANGVTSVFSIKMPKRKQFYQQEDDDFTSLTYCEISSDLMMSSSKPKVYVAKYPSLDFVAQAPGNSRSPIVVIRALAGMRNRVVIGQEDGTVCVADVAPNRGIYAFRAHEQALRGGVLVDTELMTWGGEKGVRKWEIGEIALIEPGKKGRKKHARGKKKQKGVRIAEKKDDFFADY
jgi:WD40 repeat protein